MPGFPLFIAGGLRLFGENLLAIRVLLAGVGTAACGLVYALARELFDRNTALGATVIAALFPTFIVFSVLFLSETLFALALLASLVLVARLARPARGSLLPNDLPAGAASGPRVGLAMLAGLACGIATLVRPTWLLIAPGFVLIFLVASRPRLRAAAIEGALVIAGTGLALAPWTIRNAFVTGHFVPTTLWVGPSLYDGLNPKATGASDMQFVETDGIYQRLNEYDADRYYRQAALEFVQSHPGRALALGAKKLWRFWNPFPNAEQFRHWAIVAAVGVSSIALLTLAAVGGGASRRSLWLWLIPAAPVLYFSLVHVVFVGSLRYRLPAEYALCVLSAAGGNRLAAKRSE